MLIANDLVAGYRRELPVLDGVSLRLSPGRTVGLLGPSGCGKSTLIRVLAMLHRPWSGDVEIDGTVVRRFRHAAPSSLRRSVAVVFQQPRQSVDPRFTLRRAIGEAVVGGAFDFDEVQRLAETVDLGGDLLDRRPHEVSEGQLQRACVARAFAASPRYLLCDEMTAMLDASTTASLVQVVRDHGKAHDTGVLAVSHDRTLLDAWCDEVLTWEEITRPERR